MSYKHGGNLHRLALAHGCAATELIDFSASINPLGPPDCLRRVISRTLDSLCHYPDPEAQELTAAIAAQLGVHEESIVPGNGSTELIYAIPRIAGRKRAIIAVPSYNDYAAAARRAGITVEEFILDEATGFTPDLEALRAQLCGDELVFLGQPNNPTGCLIPRDELLNLFTKHPATLFVIDESFADFVPNLPSVATSGLSNLIMVRSLTKFYAIPGLRLGYAWAAPKLAHRLRAEILPWSVNSLAQAAGRAVLADSGYAEESRTEITRLREELSAGLASLPEIQTYTGVANFLLLRLLKPGWDGARLARKLVEQGLVIRVCDNFPGLPHGGRSFIRLAVRSTDENQRLLQALGKIFAAPQRGHTTLKTHSLMFQGTASNAGKSVLTAALCRILLQDGVRVAPFKAQNMSLNSHVTRDGLEMGRAQVVQAQAACLAPDVRMNPVLLKPSSMIGSQVIVNGLPLGHLEVDSYINRKSTIWQSVCTAYDSLAHEYDTIILEGAGSPGEVNLKCHDIVNMRMARYARAPVLLVGDIDRGGVFASFVGTMEVLNEWERRLIAGFVVNRFRGQESLLGDAFGYTEAHTGRPVIGLIPYLSNLGLPEEDSVSFKSGLYDQSPPAGEHVLIGLIDLPHISNFTDIEPFLAEPSVHLEIIRNAHQLAACADRLAALILPGSKNVIHDLSYLRSSGLATLIKDLVEREKVELIGICGGFQMLGKEINDPHGLESDGSGGQGLGLLNLTTSLEQDKTLRRCKAVHLDSGLPLHGYEIHHGRTQGLQRPVLKESGGDNGAASGNGLVWGTYLHGIFDSDPFRHWFIDRLLLRRGLSCIGLIHATHDLEAAFDRLADVVRKGLDMNRIYQLLKL